jgi:iron-sulfur cluster assembly protein
MDMISITDSARDKIKQLMEEEDTSYLRVEVMGGGCSGLSYKFEFTNDTDTDKGDDIETINEIPTVINARTLMYVLGSTLDYTDGLNGKGLEITNPNATRTCGCGESFSV